MAALPKHICHVGVIVERARRQQLVVLVAVKVVRRTGRVSVAVPAFIAVYHVAALAVAVNAVKLVLGEQARVLLERKVELGYVISNFAHSLRNKDCGRLPVAHAPRFA